jgi:uncharacterized protein
MSGERFLLDTSFIQALLNPRDRYHDQARLFEWRLVAAREVWLTEEVQIEVGDALSRLSRGGGSAFIRGCYRTPDIKIVRVEPPLLERALALYEARTDKEWGLTDCISFIVMEQQGLIDALTSDVHFRQAGYRALLAETP